MSFYKKKLDEARKQVVEEERLAKLEGSDSTFGAPSAAQQKAIQQEGLMRPKARPGTGGDERQPSLGMRLMRQLAQDSGTDLAPEESLRPKARPEGKYEGNSGGSASAGDYGDANDFVNRLIQSESSGNSQAEITIKDGRKFVGAGQFGEARLNDYKRAKGASFTQSEFQNDPNLQKKVMAWHISDIDRAIDSTKGSGSFNRNGLRAVAHLGGIGGMRKYVQSGGTYNPSDELGTSLAKYYRKFTKP